jgi:hypothetical protein
VFGEETRDEARRSGPVVTGDEVDCVSLDALQSVDVLLLIRIPDRVGWVGRLKEQWDWCPTD